MEERGTEEEKCASLDYHNPHHLTGDQRNGTGSATPVSATPVEMSGVRYQGTGCDTRALTLGSPWAEWTGSSFWGQNSVHVFLFVSWCGRCE